MSQRKRLRVAASDCLPSFLPAEGIPMASREEVVRKRPASARWEKPMKQGKPIKKRKAEPFRHTRVGKIQRA